MLYLYGWYNEVVTFSLLYLRRKILLISLGFTRDYWPKTNQETSSLLFFWVWISLTSVGIFLVKSTHQTHAEVKTGQNTASASTACHSSRVHTQQQLQGLLPHKFVCAHKQFWDQKTGEVPWTNKPHNRLRETFTQFPIWGSYWDTIPKGHPRGLSKQGSGPSYHLSQQILACFGAVLNWQANRRRQRGSNILHLKPSLKSS